MWIKGLNTDKIGKYKAIKHKFNKELEINSKYGFIWPYSKTHVMVCITSATVANKFLPDNYPRAKTGEDSLIKVPLSELDMWVKILKIKNNRNSMIDRANAGG